MSLQDQGEANLEALRRRIKRPPPLRHDAPTWFVVALVGAALVACVWALFIG